MQPLSDLSNTLRRAIKKRQRRLSRKKQTRSLLSETLEDRRLLAGQPLEHHGGKGQSDRPAAEPTVFEREKPPAVDLTELTRGKSSAWQKASASVFGTDTGAKDGALRKVGTQLAFLFHEFDEHNEREKNDKRFPNPLKEFTPTDRIIKIHDQVDNEKVIVDIVTHGDPNAVKEDLVKLGVDVTGVYGKIVSGWAPIQTIDQLADHRNIRSVRPFLAETASGSTTSQGDAAQLSDDLRVNNGVDGFGVTVGVLSDSYDNNDSVTTAADDIASGDLPANVNVLSDMASGGSDEGRAMLQIIHDVAPGADLAFATATQGQAAFAQSIRDLHQTAGADVIVDDVLYYAEPFFQDGIVSQAIDEVNAAGVAYFVAAGNNADHSYESGFREANNHGAGAFLSVQDAPAFLGGKSHDFDPDPGITNDKQGFKLDAGHSITLSFQWDQPFASVTGSNGATTDMDIYILDSSNKVIAASQDSNIGADAVEVLHFTNDTTSTQDYSLMLVNYGSGDNPGIVKYIEFKSPGSPGMREIEFATNSSTIYGHSNATGAATVGASFWPETPEFSSNPNPTVQAFSSVGGTTVYFDPNGASYPSPAPRDKPDFTAPDGGNTTFFGGDISDDTDLLPNFVGTSAAAAHAAGVAALLLEAVDGADPQELYTSLRNTATAIPGSSTKAGQGMIDAVQAELDLQDASDGAMASLDATTFNNGESTISTTAKTLNTYIGDEQVPVDTGETYVLSGWAKSGNPYAVNNVQTLGFSSYDAQGFEIEAHHVRNYSGSQTYLTQQLDENETVVHVNDVSGWLDEGSNSSQRVFAWYPYLSYPDYGYSRNVIDNAWDVGGVDDTNKTITLNTAWADPNPLPVNTEVANAYKGPNFNYWPLDWVAIDNSDWQQFSETITGESTTDKKKFRTATEFISPHLLTNYHSSSQGVNEINWRNIRITREGRFKAGDKVDLHVNSIDYDPAAGYTYQWNQVSGPLVDLQSRTSAIATIDKLKDSLVDYSLGFEVLVTLGSNPPTKEVVTVHVEAGDTQVDPVEDYLDATTYFDEGFGETISTNQRRVDMFGDTLIPVDPSLTYKLSGEVKVSATEYQAGNSQYFGFASFDDQGREIKARNVRLFGSSAHTYLADDLVNGSKILKLNDASNWADGSDPGYQRNLAWYPAGDSEDYVYTPHVEYSGSGLWDTIDYMTNTITLKDPWPHDTLDAGTKVGNAEGGPNFHYAVLGGTPVTNTDFDTEFETITGTSTTSHDAFKPHTAYIKPAIITNNHGSGNNEVTWRNIRFEHYTLTTYRVGDTVDLQVEDVQFPGAEITYHWTQIGGPPVPLGDANTKTAHISQLPDRLRDYTLDFQVDISDGTTTITKEVSIDVDEPDGHEAALGAATTSLSTANIGQTVTLSIGDVRSDFDGPLTYRWEQVTGPAVTLVDADEPAATFDVPSMAADELRFQVTVSDGSLQVVDEVTVNVNAIAPDVRFELDIVDKGGEPVSVVSVGDEFTLRFHVEDNRDNAYGLFSSYADIWFDQSLVSVTKEPDFSERYSFATSADIDSPGVINETGGASEEDTPVGSFKALVYSVTMIAEAAGTLTFRSDPADDVPPHEVTLYNQDAPVSPYEIAFGSVDLTIDGSETLFTTSEFCGSPINLTLTPDTIHEPDHATRQSTVRVWSASDCTVNIVLEDQNNGSGDSADGDAYFIEPHEGNPQDTGIVNLSAGEVHLFYINSMMDADSVDDTVKIIATGMVDDDSSSGGGGSGGAPSVSDTLTIKEVTPQPPSCEPRIEGLPNGSTSIMEGDDLKLDFTTTSCSDDVTVNWTLTNATYGSSPPADLHVKRNGTVQPSGGPVTFTSLPGFLDLETHSDSEAEGPSSIKFTATVNGSSTDYTVNILDAGSCSYSVAASPGTLDEGDANPIVSSFITVTATGSEAACAGDVDFSWIGTGNRAQEGGDFAVINPVSGTATASTTVPITSSTGSLSASVELRLKADEIQETQASQVSFTVQMPDGTTDNVAVTIEDDDGLNGHLDVENNQDATEPHSHYYCGGGQWGRAIIKPISTSNWNNVNEDTITVRLGGTATYGVDYQIYVESGHDRDIAGPSPNDPNTYLKFEKDLSKGNIVVSVIPFADSDETEGNEDVEFTVVTSSAFGTTSEVTISDLPESIEIEAVKMAKEENEEPGQFKIKPGHTSEKLCTEVRLLIDTSVTDAATPSVDYSLARVTPPGGLTINSGNVAHQDTANDSIIVNEADSLLVDVNPVDDPLVENLELVVARVQAKAEKAGWLTNPNSATVTIEDNDELYVPPAASAVTSGSSHDDCSCSCEVCGADNSAIDLQGGTPKVGVARGWLSFAGQSTHGTNPVVRGQFAKDNSWPNDIIVRAAVDNWNPNDGENAPGLGDPIDYTLDTNGYLAPDVAFGVPLDVDGLATGSYRIRLTGNDGDPAIEDDWEAWTSHIVVNRWDDYDIAPGLTFPFLKEVIDAPMYVVESGTPVEHDGVAVIRGDNSVSWYRESAGTYIPPAETVSTLTKVGSTYELEDKYGTVDVFNVSDGRQTKSIDRNGNETEFFYDGNGRLDRIVDPFQRETNFDYNVQPAGVRITDFANRETVVTYNSTTRVLEVEHPDPDVTGHVESPQPKDKFEFDAQHRITKATRTATTGSTSQVTEYMYDDEDHGYTNNWGRLSSIKRPDGTTWTLNSVRQTEGLPQPGLHTWRTTGSPENVDILADLESFSDVTEVIDGRGNTTTYTLDHRGRVTNIKDAHEQNTIIQRRIDRTDGVIVKDHGEIEFITTPDPDNFTARPDLATALKLDHSPAIVAQITGFKYDDQLNVTRQDLPQLNGGASSLEWADPNGTDPFHYGRAPGLTNELGQLTDYDVDSSNGNIDSITVFSPNSPPDRTRTSPGRNPLNNLDADGDGVVTEADAKRVRDLLNQMGSPGHLAPHLDPGAGFPDTNGDGFNSPSDVLLILNYLAGTGSPPVADSDYTQPSDYSIVYDYTTTGTLPLGLLLSEEVTTGRPNPTSTLVTSYEYYSDNPTDPLTIARFGLLKSVTYAHGTLDAATVNYDYDVRGNLKTFTDEIGRVTNFVFDQLDRIVSVTTPDPDGHGQDPSFPQRSLVTNYVYDAFGNVTAVEKKNYNVESATETFHTTCYYYDSMNRIEWVVEPDPDANTQRAGCAIGSVPSDRTNAATTWPGRPSTHYQEYDGNGNLIKLNDAEDRTTEFAYDALDRLIEIVEPAPGASLSTDHGEVLQNGGPKTTFIYDNVGNLWSMTDSLGHTTEYRYDMWNRLTKVLEPSVEVESTQVTPTTEYEYTGTPFGWIHEVTDAEGRTTESQLDFLGRLTYVAEPHVDGVQPLTFLEYHADGQLKSTTDPERNTTTYEYDDRARLVKTVFPQVYDAIASETKSPYLEYEYDAANQLKMVTQILTGLVERETKYEYDEMGRIELVTYQDPDGDPMSGDSSPTVSYLFDSAGNLLKTTDALGHTMKYEYDQLFRTVNSIDGNGQATSYKYDKVHNRTELTDPQANTTKWVYDKLDRPFSVENQNGDKRFYFYDAVGNLRQETDRNGRITTYDYDDLYRVTQEQWDDASSRTFSYTYDLVDNLLTAADSEGTADFAYRYDNLDRVMFDSQVHNSLPESVVFSHDYDLIGNRTLLAANIGGGLVKEPITGEFFLEGGTDDFRNVYDYDSLYRLESVAQGSAGGNAVAGKQVTFGYDLASQMTDIHRYSEGASGSSLIAHSLLNYDLTGRLTSITHSREEITTPWDGAVFPTDPSTVTDTIAAYFLEYDAGNRLGEFSSWRDRFETTFGYDNRDQLLSANYADGNGVTAPFKPANETYDFDNNGNRDSTGYVTDPDNRVQKDGTFDYLYDGEGNRTRRTRNSDDSYTEYVWDHRNRLVSVLDRTSSGQKVKQVDYTYDVFDRRVGKKLDVDGDGEFDEATTWVYSGQHIALEFTDADGDGVLPAALSHRYLHGPVVDMILADEHITEPWQEGEVYWPLTDHLGSVRDVIDSEGVVQNHVIYDAFGNRLDGGSETFENVDFLFGYTGRDWDGDIGLQYNRARWYDPSDGRWLSEDPIGFSAGDSNLYRYVGNQPSLRSDPSGLQDPYQENKEYYDRLVSEASREKENQERVIAVDVVPIDVFEEDTKSVLASPNFWSQVWSYNEVRSEDAYDMVDQVKARCIGSTKLKRLTVRTHGGSTGFLIGSKRVKGIVKYEINFINVSMLDPKSPKYDAQLVAKLQELKSVFTEDAELILWSCEGAKGTTGKRFMQLLANTLNVKVWAIDVDTDVMLLQPWEGKWHVSTPGKPVPPANKPVPSVEPKGGGAN